MPIDKCMHSFEEMATYVLPNHFKSLEQAIKKPIPAADFVGPKNATKQLLTKLSFSVDFPGCYVFLNDGKAVYTGISRTVIKRLVQHLNYNTHFSANLAYRMASKEHPHKMKRDQAMKDAKFKSKFSEKQKQLQGMDVAFVEIDNDLELYLFEVYAAMRLDSETWNTFRTH